jgi:hypothetical protein
MHVYIHVHICVYTVPKHSVQSPCARTEGHVQEHKYIHVYIYVYIYVCVYTLPGHSAQSPCARTEGHVQEHKYTHVYIYVYIYVYIHYQGTQLNLRTLILRVACDGQDKIETIHACIHTYTCVCITLPGHSAQSPCAHTEGRV